MNTPVLALPAIPEALKRKRVMLIDASHAKRDLRAEVMRKLGIDVDSAADIAEARIWWRPAVYDLVLINMEKGRGQRDKFVMTCAAQPQRSGWLSWLANQNISPIHLTKIRNWQWRTVTKRPPSAAQRTFSLPIRGNRISVGAFLKLHDKSPRSDPRPLLARKRCAPCLQILNGGQRN